MQKRIIKVDVRPTYVTTTEDGRYKVFASELPQEPEEDEPTPIYDFVAGFLLPLVFAMEGLVMLFMAVGLMFAN